MWRASLFFAPALLAAQIVNVSPAVQGASNLTTPGALAIVASAGTLGQSASASSSGDVLSLYGAASSYPEFRIRDMDGTLGYLFRQTSDINSDATTFNDILQIGTNVAAGGGLITAGKSAIYMQFERSWLDTETPPRFVSEWHIDHINSDGTIRRTLQSNSDDVSHNGLLTIQNSAVSQNAYSDQDYTTAASGTNSSLWAGFTVGNGTLTALNSSVTRTTAASLYISGPPTAGTNTTITGPYAVYGQSGYWYINTSAPGGGLWIGGTSTTANRPPFNLSVAGQAAIGSEFAANNLSSAAYQLAVGSGSGDNGLTIVSDSTHTGNIYFANANVSNSNNRIGQIVYNHNGNTMSFYTSATLALQMSGNSSSRNYAFTGNNAQATGIKQLTELTTIAASATTATSIQIPANVIVLGVSVRTTVAITGASTYTVTGTGSSTTFNTAAVSASANATNPGTAAGAYYNATAQTITFTPNTTPSDNAGRVRVTVHYIEITPATS